METPSSENTSHSKSSSNKSAIDEPSIPYFLPHSDSPGLVLVSQPLTRDNYASWSRAMLIAWSVKNKLGFVDGSIVKPKGIDLDFIHSWTRNNKIVIAWILNSVSKEISASVIFGDSTREIWLNLKDPLQQRNGLRIFQLRRELMNLVQDQNSISVYFTKLKTIWEELSNYRPVCTCGGVKNLSSHYQMEYIMSFLMRLNDSFAQVRGQLLLIDPLPSINKVFSLISQEEHQKKIGSHINAGSDSAGTMAFAVKTDNSKASKGYKEHKKDRPFCTHCNFHGHPIDKC